MRTGDEIIDETDVYVDVDNHVKVDGRSKFDFTKLRRLDSAVVDATLTEAEVKAIAQHLGTELKQPADALMALVRRASVVDHERRTPENELDAGRPPEPSDVVYERGFPANFATLVLSGKLSVKAGVDGFRAEAGPWTLLGAGALRDENFVPDFSAHVATCVEIKILRRAIPDALVDSHTGRHRFRPVRLPVTRREVERAASCPQG